LKRHTLADAFSCEGVGLHGGAPARVTVRAAEAGSGLVLVRTDLPDEPAFGVHLEAVRGASFATRLGAVPPSPAEVSTVEHLLAALAGARIDDARIEVEGPEVPVLDGSALPFSRAIEEVGVVPTSGVRRCIALHRSVAIEEGDRRLEASPAPCFGLEIEIDFDHPAIGRQSISYPDMSPEAFARELAPARTFGFFSEVEWLRAQGRAAGASLDNTVVLDDATVMNQGGLRFADEFVRHKALDLVGDLALLGAPLCARVHAVRGGHALHHRLVAAILAAPDAWHWED
jgi:UDP-3-O-[3-hydroxymyristoyl] N-acetylglucosamine deacetylase